MQGQKQPPPKRVHVTSWDLDGGLIDFCTFRTENRPLLGLIFPEPVGKLPEDFAQRLIEANKDVFFALHRAHDDYETHEVMLGGLRQSDKADSRVARKDGCQSPLASDVMPHLAGALGAEHDDSRCPDALDKRTEGDAHIQIVILLIRPGGVKTGPVGHTPRRICRIGPFVKFLGLY